MAHSTNSRFNCPPYSDIFAACSINDFEAVGWFLGQDNDVDERNEQSLTCLHICASKGHLETARVLTSHGASLDLKDYENGWTALHRAMYFGHPRVGIFLIKCGAKLDLEYFGEYINEVDRVLVKDKEGFTPLDLLSLQLSGNLSDSRRRVEAGTLLCFGKSDFTLGVPLPKSADVTRPRRIDTLLSESIVHVSASKYHSLAITKEGRVYSWGHGRSGRLGHSDEHSQPEPKLIAGLLKVQITRIAAAEGHSLAISTSGDIFSWGSNTFGQLGHGNTETSKISSFPKKIDVLKKDFVVGIAAGDTHSLCFTESGEVYAWGSNKVGQLGIRPSETSSGPSGVHCSALPRKVTMPFLTSASRARYVGDGAEMTVTQIVASHQSSMLLCHCKHSSDAIRTKLWKYSEVYQWGDGAHYPRKVHFSHRSGQQRSMSFDQSTNGLDSFNSKDPNIITQIAAGRRHFAAISSSGLVYTWGAGSDQLGHGFDESQLSNPQVVEALLPENGGGKVVSISASESRTCVVTDVGDLFAWGTSDDKGVLAPGSRIYQPVPKKIHGVKRAIKVATGADHTLVLLSPSMPFPTVDNDVKIETDIPSLQDLCQRELVKSVNMKNVLDGLSFAERFNAKQLGAYCLDYVRDNFDAILVQTNPNKIERYIEDWSWPQQLHAMPKTTRAKPVVAKETEPKLIVSSSQHIASSESKSLKDIQSSEELLKLIRTTKKKIVNIEEIEMKIKLESYVPSLEQKNKLAKKVLIQEELAKMEQMLVRIKVRESHQPQMNASNKIATESILPDKPQSLAPKANNSALSTKAVEPVQPSAAVTDRKPGPKKASQAEKKKAADRNQTPSAVTDGQFSPPATTSTSLNSPWVSTAALSESLVDNPKSISAVGENGRTVLSPPSTTHSTPTFSPKTMVGGNATKKSHPVVSAPAVEDSRKVVVNLFDLITPKKGKELSKVATPPSVVSASPWSASNSTTTPSVVSNRVETSKLSLAEIQAQEEAERRNSSMTQLKGNDIPWHVQRKPRAVSFDRVIVEQVSQQQEDDELQEALRLIAEMEARDASAQKPRKHNKPRPSSQSQKKTKAISSN